MTLLRSALLPDGRRVDVVLDGGLIATVRPAGAPADAPGADVGGPDDDVIDLSGYLLLAAPAEPHAHLDKAFTADAVPNPDGDLLGAISNWMSRYPERTVDEIAGRARRAALRNVSCGVTSIRSHVDVNEFIGLRAVEALLRVRAELAHLVDIQLVALAARPLPGEAGKANRRLLLEALDAGVDVGGGCPHVDPDPAAHLELALEAAAQASKPLDLHMDEHIDAAHLDLPLLARRVRESGFANGVVASHCVSLGMQTLEVQQEVAAQVAEAGISVVTLPQTNLFLQARGQRCAPPRGLTPVHTLLEAGVNVAAGGDNLQDPFNLVGRGDPLETAALLVVTAHLSPEQAYDCVSNGSRRAMGLAPVDLAAGSPADLLAVRASTVREAIASAPHDRMVFRSGRLVSQTRSEVSFADAGADADAG